MATTPSTPLEQAARNAPRSAVEAATHLLQASDDPAQAAFLTRAVEALARLAPAISRRALGDVAGAPSEFAVLSRALNQPEALDVLGVTGQGDKSCLAGIDAKEQLLTAEGGTISGAEAARLLGISRQAVDKRRRAGRLIGLSLGRRGFAYPVWQFQDGEVLPGLDRVLRQLDNDAPWVWVLFLLNPHERLAGATPLAALRQGRVDEVLAVASWFGEQVAA